MKKSSCIHTILFVFSLFVLNGYVWCEESPVISNSDGVASIYKDNIANARNDAIKDALKKAVSGALESQLSSSKIRQNFDLIEKEIIGKAQQYVNNYKVISEKAIGNIYQVTIETVISKVKIKEDLLSIGLLSSHKESPKALIMVAEEDTGKGNFNFWWHDADFFEGQGASGAVLEARLSENDFQIVDIHDRSIAGNIPDFYRNEDLSIDAITYFGRLYSADIVIYGKTYTLPSKASSGSTGPSIHAIVSLTAIDPGTGEVLLSSENEELSDQAGLPNAFKKATGLLAERIISLIADKWSSPSGGLSNIEMSITGISSYINFMKFKEAVKDKAKGVQKIRQRGFGAGKAKLEVEVMGGAQKLADELTMINYEGFLIDIAEITKDRIHVNMRPQ